MIDEIRLTESSVWYTEQSEKEDVYCEGWNDCNRGWMQRIEKMPRVGEWTPCSEDMPAEHESIFARFKGTSKWMKGMFEKRSDDVIVTVKFTDGTRKTMAMHTTDGEWRTSDLPVHHEVIAWKPLPPAYKEGE